MQLGYKQPVVHAYAHWLKVGAPAMLAPGSIIRIESPGEDEEVRKELVARGLMAMQQEAAAAAVLNSPAAHGAIGYMLPWYKGYCHWLQEAAQLISAQQGMRVMNDPAGIALQFDKPRCQALLQANGVPVPRRLGPVHSYDHLLQQMQQHGTGKVFIKPAHASSASGIVAFRKQGHRVQAVSPVEMVPGPQGWELYNSLTVRTYHRETEIAALVNRLVPENIFAEEWLPKATLQEKYFDIRVLVIAGRARHTVIRTSRGIITNLHLGNQRGDMQIFLEQIGAKRLEAARRAAEKAAACFPHSLYMGVDVLLTAGRQEVYVLEVNAFGDLLPNLVQDNETCYEAEIKTLAQQMEEPAV